MQIQRQVEEKLPARALTDLIRISNQTLRVLQTATLRVVDEDGRVHLYGVSITEIKVKQTTNVSVWLWMVKLSAVPFLFLPLFSVGPSSYTEIYMLLSDKSFTLRVNPLWKGLCLRWKSLLFTFVNMIGDLYTLTLTTKKQNFRLQIFTKCWVKAISHWKFKD